MLCNQSETKSILIKTMDTTDTRIGRKFCHSFNFSATVIEKCFNDAYLKDHFPVNNLKIPPYKMCASEMHHSTPRIRSVLPSLIRSPCPSNEILPTMPMIETLNNTKQRLFEQTDQSHTCTLNPLNFYVID